MPCSLAHCLLNGVQPSGAVLELWLPMWRVTHGPALAMYHAATGVVQGPPGEGAAGAQIAIPRFIVHLYLAEGANIAGVKPFFTLQINLKGHHASPKGHPKGEPKTSANLGQCHREHNVPSKSF